MFGLPASLTYSTIKTLEPHLPPSLVHRTEYLRLPFLPLSIYVEPLASRTAYSGAIRGELWERLSKLTGSRLFRSYAKSAYSDFKRGVWTLMSTKDHSTLPPEMQSMGSLYSIGWTKGGREGLKGWAERKLGLGMERGPTVREKVSEWWSHYMGHGVQGVQGEEKAPIAGSKASGRAGRDRRTVYTSDPERAAASTASSSPLDLPSTGKSPRSWWDKLTKRSSRHSSEFYTDKPHLDEDSQSRTSGWSTTSKIALGLTAATVATAGLVYHVHANPDSAISKAVEGVMSTVASSVPGTFAGRAGGSGTGSDLELGTGRPLAPD